ncbi:MAG TPA: ABC transporter substrate-binding protein [Trueperaceae bacterium]
MKRLLVAMLALALFGLVGAQTLVYGVSGPPSSLDSVDSQDGNSLVVSGQITETLIGFAPGSTELIPRLATEWSSNEDGSVWTFELREGVTFHDGTPFNAEAVAWNFSRWNDPEHPYSFRDQGKTYTPWTWVFGGPKGDGSILDEVVAIDENTVEFRMNQPSPFLPAQLAAIYFQIDSPTAVMEAGVDYGTPAVGSVGTGPFKFVEWREGQGVVVERNDDYWGGPAKVERVFFRPITEPTARLAELQAGTIDIAVLLAADDLQAVESNPDLEAVTAEAELNVGYLAFHQANEPLDDPLVRQAIAHAIDRQAIVDAFYQGLGVVAEDHLPPTLFGHGEPWPYDYDPERARELLAEAGYPDGFSTQLWYMPVSRPYYPAPQPIAETMASYLADVGIDAQLMTEDWTTYLADYSTGKFPMYMLGWNADYADPDNFLMTFFGPDAQENQLGWDSPEVTEALTTARQVADPDRRAELYSQVVNTVAEEVPSIPMAHNRSLNAVRSNIEGFVMSPLGYSSVSLHEVSKE